MFNYIPFIGDSFGCHNLNSVDPMPNFLGFSESLEKNSSNGVIVHGPRRKNDKLGPRQNFGLQHII